MQESQAQATTTSSSSPNVKHGLDGYPLLMQWSIKIGTVILGLAAMLLGVLTCISVEIRCIFAGIILILGGFIVVAFESPILFGFVKCIEPVTAFSEKRAPWQKFLIYVIPPPIAIVLCPSVTPIFGAIFLLIVAFLYLFFVILRARGQY